MINIDCGPKKTHLNLDSAHTSVNEITNPKCICTVPDKGLLRYIVVCCCFFAGEQSSEFVFPPRVSEAPQPHREQQQGRLSRPL